jgi:hypothetical protein
MPTLRRILKYAPTVVMWLLVVAWVTSLVGTYSLAFKLPSGKLMYTVGGSEGSLGGAFDSARWQERGWYWHRRSEPLNTQSLLGRFTAHRLYKQTFGNYWYVGLPFSAPIKALAPLAIGPFISFRFRVWQYLAYTALVAVQLAYYLRWQL